MALFENKQNKLEKKITDSKRRWWSPVDEQSI